MEKKAKIIATLGPSIYSESKLNKLVSLGVDAFRINFSHNTSGIEKIINRIRKIEKKISIKELKKSNQVIALGGGAIMNFLIRKEVKNSSISFWLDLSLKSILPRLKITKKRPLLDKDNLEDSINKIYSQRKKIYNESDFKIKCDSMKIQEIVDKIVGLYEDSKN